MPVFALANIGIVIDRGPDRGRAHLARRARDLLCLRRRQAARDRRQLLAGHAHRAALAGHLARSGGAGVVAGIGFTVSILISTLAFDGRELEEAKLAVLTAAVCASVLGWLVFRIIALLPPEVMTRQFARTAESIVDLAAPVDPERDHIRGDDDAPVTLVEYGDFECPFCGRAEPVLRQLLNEFGNDLRFVFRHLPLSDVHPRAQLAAEAAEAADDQGAFWEMHDLLFDHQDALEPKNLVEYARELGLDVDRFTDAAPPTRARRADRLRRRRRRPERRLGHADLLRQRHPAPGRLRHRHPHGSGARRPPARTCFLKRFTEPVSLSSTVSADFPPRSCDLRVRPSVTASTYSRPVLGARGNLGTGSNEYKSAERRKFANTARFRNTMGHRVVLDSAGGKRWLLRPGTSLLEGSEEETEHHA